MRKRVNLYQKYIFSVICTSGFTEVTAENNTDSFEINVEPNPVVNQEEVLIGSDGDIVIGGNDCIMITAGQGVNEPFIVIRLTFVVSGATGVTVTLYDEVNQAIAGFPLMVSNII